MTIEIGSKWIRNVNQLEYQVVDIQQDIVIVRMVVDFVGHHVAYTKSVFLARFSPMPPEIKIGTQFTTVDGRVWVITNVDAFEPYHQVKCVSQNALGQPVEGSCPLEYVQQLLGTKQTPTVPKKAPRKINVSKAHVV